LVNGIGGGLISGSINTGINPRIRENVSVIDTATKTVIATIPVGHSPHGVAVSPSISIGECVGCQ